VSRAPFTASAVLISALGLSVAGAETQAAPSDPPSDAAAPSQHGGADGLSASTAVVISARDDVPGIRSEYGWIAEHYPGSKRVRQALTAWSDEHKRYDVITIRTNSGKKVMLWFDISAMFE
jgi:hypothetical protein